MTYQNTLHNDDGDQHSAEGEAEAINKIYVYTQPIIGGELGGYTSFDVLLGMDVITSGRLVVDKDGTFSFTYQ